MRLESRHHEIQLYAPDESPRSSLQKDDLKELTPEKQARNMAVIEEFADSRFDTVKHEEGEVTAVPQTRKRTIKAT